MSHARAIDIVEELLEEPPFAISLVTDTLKQFSKAARAQQLYLPNNPMHARAMQVARDGFNGLWEQTDSVKLQITDADFRWWGQVVMEEAGRTSDSLPWMFYKDGVRELTFVRGFENDELDTLLRIIQRTRLAPADGDDLLTLLWEQEFSFLRYKYVEIGASETAPSPLTARSHEPGERIVSPRAMEESSSDERLISSSIARMDDYDTTLYFLDESEIDYLQREIRTDFSGDLRPAVIASLLDTYEQETDPTVREEIANNLDHLFLLMLSLMYFSSAAYLIREAKLTAGRAVELSDNERDRLMSLSGRLSEREPLEQLLTALEQRQLRPPQTDLHDLFNELQPQVLEIILAWIGRTSNAELRALLESAGSRMAASHTSELVRLIGSQDDSVAIEAIRRAGAMHAAAAVPALSRMLSEGPPEMRHLAVSALSQIASPGALQALERAVNDDDADVRIAAVKMLAGAGHVAAVKRIEEQLRSNDIKERPLPEKMALFESYGALCGDAGIEFLDGLLNSRKLLGKREPSELRACAAVALGKIGSDAALQALRKSANDSDVIVRNAVSRAARGGS